MEYMLVEVERTLDDSDRVLETKSVEGVDFIPRIGDWVSPNEMGEDVLYEVKAVIIDSSGLNVPPYVYVSKLGKRSNILKDLS